MESLKKAIYKLPVDGEEKCFKRNAIIRLSRDKDISKIKTDSLLKRVY